MSADENGAQRRSFLQTVAGGLCAGLAGAGAATAGTSGDQGAKLPEGVDDEPEREAGSERVKAYIRRSRQEALAELKPSTKQIARALDLHRQAIVCDPMGGHSVQQLTRWFGLYSESMERSVRREMAKHSDPDWQTFRNVLSKAGNRRPAELARNARMQKDLKALMRSGGVTVGVTSTAPWTLDQIALRTFVFDAVDHVEKVTRFDHIAEVKKAAKFGAIAHNHGLPVVGDMEGKKALEMFYLLGIRGSQLTHGDSNQYGGGQRSNPEKGLTDLGREMIKRMNELGIIVDASHTSPQTALDMADASDEPVLVSHTACRAVHHGYAPWRNMTDEGLKAIADTGGVVAICTHPSIAGGYSIDAGIKHIRHAVDLLGPEHVAVSSDRTLFLQDLPPDVIKKVKPEGLVSFEQASKYPGFWKWRRYKEAWKLCAQPSSLQPCAWPYNVTLPLVMEGYSDDQIRKIIGENFLRVARQVLQTSPTGAQFVG